IAEASGLKVYRHNGAGALVLVRTVPNVTPAALAFSPDGHTLYATSTDPSVGLFVFAIDGRFFSNSSRVIQTLPASFFGGATLSAVTVSPDFSHVYAVSAAAQTTFALERSIVTGMLGTPTS